MNSYNEVYDRRSLIKNLVIFGIMIACMYPTQGAGFAVILFFAVYAIKKKNDESLLLIMLLTIGAQVGNNVIMPKGTIFNITQKGLMFFLAISITKFNINGHISPLLRPFLLLMPYIFYMLIPSTIGWNPIVSYLKLALFISCFFAFLGIANTIIIKESVSINKVRSVFLSLCCFSIFGSMILLPFPSISQLTGVEYMRALKSGYVPTSLFKGIMFQSQTLGPLIAMLAIIIFSDYIISVRKTNKLYLALIICVPILIYKTSSRTAMGTLIAGIMFAVYIFVIHTKQIETRWKSNVITYTFIIVIIGTVVLCFSSSGQEGITKYVFKNQDLTSIGRYNIDYIILTRRGNIERAMYNFMKSPLFGNGFQVSENMTTTSVNGMRSLLSAPVEKSVWITAILEEGGVVGMILFLCFGLNAIPSLIRLKAYIAAIMLFSMFVVNLGEFLVFSMSGAGGYCWALCFIAIILDVERLREEKHLELMTNEDSNNTEDKIKNTKEI